MKNIPLVLILVILFIGCKSSKNTTSDNKAREFNIEIVDYLFRDYEGNRPSASLIVIKDGEIKLAKSYGMADMEKNVLATPYTNYRIASVTKQFTALAIMLLIHQEKIDYTTNLTPNFSKISILW